jgi:hypothetical protein
MQAISDEINSNQTKLQVITSNRERVMAKKQMLMETQDKYKSISIFEL